jgi:hypothetical protein
MNINLYKMNIYTIYGLEDSVLNETVKNKKIEEKIDYEFKTKFPTVTDYDDINEVIKVFPQL